jgi:hypothetical protein
VPAALELIAAVCVLTLSEESGLISPDIDASKCEPSARKPQRASTSDRSSWSVTAPPRLFPSLPSWLEATEVGIPHRHRQSARSAASNLALPLRPQRRERSHLSAGDNASTGDADLARLSGSAEIRYPNSADDGILTLRPGSCLSETRDCTVLGWGAVRTPRPADAARAVMDREPRRAAGFYFAAGLSTMRSSGEKMTPQNGDDISTRNLKRPQPFALFGNEPSRVASEREKYFGNVKSQLDHRCTHLINF